MNKVLLILLLIFTSCATTIPSSDSKLYKFTSIGTPPWKENYERVHQESDPDWRTNLPWAQDEYLEENIEVTDYMVKVWSIGDTKGLLYSNFTFKYGRVSAEIKMPDTKGIWSAFWLFGDTGMPEYDIIEHCGGVDHGLISTHWGFNYNGFKKKKSKKIKHIDPMDWNVYSIDVTPYYVTYYVNNKRIHRTKQVSSSDKHIILSASNGDFCVLKDDDTNDYMAIKWVLLEKYD